MIIHDPERQLWEDLTAALKQEVPSAKFTNTDYKRGRPLMQLLELYLEIYRYKHEEIPKILRRWNLPA